MIGRCPHCKIDLNKPPFNGRNTNEVVLTLNYRNKVENNEKLESVEKMGYCELCNAKLEDLEEQEKSGSK